MRIWRDLDPTRLSASWVQQQIGNRLFLSLARAQELAAMAADVFTDLILLDQGIEVDADGQIRPAGLAGVASDGRPLDSLLLQPLIAASAATAAGADTGQALQYGANALTRIVGTQVQDAGRGGTGLGIAVRPGVGYLRVVNPGACSRCVILAGRFYRWSDGFLRHPLCGCRNIPSTDPASRDARTDDPMAVFNALSETEQNRQFTKAGAQAIREGADISQVVNSRRGALGLSTAASQRRSLQRQNVNGQSVYTTTVNGQARPARLMPESIYAMAGNRTEAVRLLRVHGYIT